MSNEKTITEPKNTDAGISVGGLLCEARHRYSHQIDEIQYCTCGSKIASLNGWLRLAADQEPFKAGETDCVRGYEGSEDFVTAAYCVNSKSIFDIVIED